MKIKFRVWSKSRQEMIYPDKNGWFHKVYVADNGYLQDIQLGVAVDLNGSKLELQQYTGLKDKNGKEIYEGDVFIKVTTGSIFEVYYCENSACYRAKRTDGWHFDLKDLYPITDWKVIGNIYENELVQP